MYQVFFEMNINLCERFPALDPFIVRQKTGREVFLMVKRLNEYNARSNKHTKTKNGKPIIRKHAGDKWF